MLHGGSKVITHNNCTHMEGESLETSVCNSFKDALDIHRASGMVFRLVHSSYCKALYPCSVEGEEIILHWTEMGVAHSKSQRELAEGVKAGNTEDIKNLDYFTAQLQLFCNMCFNRQYLAILKIKDQLPINIVLRCAKYILYILHVHVYTHTGAHCVCTCTCTCDCLGCAVLLCLVCLTLLASFFHLSFKNTQVCMYILYIHVHVHVIIMYMYTHRCMENKSLPFSLRAGFCHIIQCVHLDINPQETVNPVGYSRLWSQIPASTTTVSEYSPWLDE